MSPPVTSSQRTRSHPQERPREAIVVAIVIAAYFDPIDRLVQSLMHHRIRLKGGGDEALVKRAALSSQ
jgi:hypothetical protein